MAERAAAPNPQASIPLGHPSPEKEGPRSVPVNLPAEALPKEEKEKPESTAEAFANAEKPLPTDPKTIYLAGLFGIAVLVACYVAQAVVVPLVMAIVLKMMLQPLVRVLMLTRMPRVVGALAAMAVLAVVLVTLGLLLSMPAASLGEAITEGLPRLEERLRFLQAPISDLQEALEKAQEVAGGGNNGENAVAIEKVGVFSFIFSGTRAALEGLLTTGIILFFLMLSGDTFLRRGVEILPNFEHKRRAVEISQQVEADISVYLLTIISMNLLVGLAVGVTVWLCGLGDPVLWGALAFILNFVPILGPITGMALLVLSGFMHFDTLGLSLLPAGLYLLIHMLEGELVTPALLARRFTMNPVAVIISIIFWFWMWGVPGAVLAVPMLAITKIICDRIKPLMAFGHFLEGEEEGAAARYVARLTRRSAPAPAHKSD
jgi:predicted PurR-regulated permease PerM